jgi:purine-nucleoside phosphorylase
MRTCSTRGSTIERIAIPGDLAAAITRALACVEVEMEAAGLYAYATARRQPVVCLAHVTNTMATAGDDFDKSGDNGVHDALTVAHAVSTALLPAPLTPRPAR